MKNDQPLLSEFKPNNYEEWKEAAEMLLKGAPFDKKMRTPTPEGITLEPIYNRDAWERLEGLEGTPGADGFLRGTLPEGHRVAPWKIAQELPYGEPAEFNKVLMEALAGGQNAINVLFDIATLKGLDPDMAASGEVGACGLSLSCLSDMQVAFKGLIPDAVSYYFQSGCSGLVVGALFEAWLAEQDIKQPECIEGGLNIDPLGQLASASALPCPLEQVYQEMAAVARYFAENRPGMTALGVSDMPYHQAGAAANEELGCVLATGLEYLRAMTANGLTIDEAASQSRLSLQLGGNFFMDMAKIRAARILWSRMVGALGASAEFTKAIIHVRTGLFNKTLHDPYVNMLRTTTEALSAVIAGVDSLCVGTFDEVVRVPDTFSRRIARNTQIILQEECELTAVIDPAGGSWFIETLTHQLAEKSWGVFQQIEAAGGMAQALAEGTLHSLIADTRKGRDQLFAQRRSILVGTNHYPNLSEKDLPPQAIDYSKLRERRAQVLGQHRVSGEEGADVKILDLLNAAAAQEGAIDFAGIIEAVSLGASVGEICKAMRASCGEPATIKPLPKSRLAASYEAMRRASREYRETNGHGPRIFLLNMGKLRRHKLRADFTRSFYETGGFEVISPKGFEDPAAAAAALQESGAQIAVLCGTDDDYADNGADFMKAAKAAVSGLHLILAGHPGDHEAAYREAGMDDFIFVKSNNYESNKALLSLLGVL